MDFSYSHIRLVVPRMTVPDVCEAIFRLAGTSYPTPIFISALNGVEVLFMTTDQEEAVRMLRSIGQKPVVLSTEQWSATDRQPACPNCGWIVSNQKCMRCRI